jgi:fumarate hydratase, class II
VRLAELWVPVLSDALSRRCTVWIDKAGFGCHLRGAVKWEAREVNTSISARKVLRWPGRLSRTAAAQRAVLENCTAVGTGINSAPGFAEAAAAETAKIIGLPFVTATFISR